MQHGGWFTVRPMDTKNCKFCHAPFLYWIKSKRTGKFYLANTRPYIPEDQGKPVDSRWVMPNHPHNCNEYRERQKQQEEARKTVPGTEEYRQESIRELKEGIAKAEADGRTEMARNHREILNNIEKENNNGH